MSGTGEEQASGGIACSFRSALISVSDLDRSASFYQALMSLHEVFREDRLVVLYGDGPGQFTLYLREAPRNAAHSGQQSLGVRSLACDVKSVAELDRIEARLRELGAFRDRLHLRANETLEVLRGFDPDRLPLTFVADDTASEMSADDYHGALATMYSVDL